MPPPGASHHSRFDPPRTRPRSSRRRWVVAVGAVVLSVVLAGGASWAVVAAIADRGVPPPAGTETRPASGPTSPGSPRTVRIVENLPLNASAGVAIDATGSRFFVTGPDEEAFGERQFEVHEIGRDAPVGVVGLSDVSVGEIALAPDGRRLYLSTSVSPAAGGAAGPTTAGLAVVDPTGPGLVATVPLSSLAGPVAVAPGGERVYVGVLDGVEAVDPVAGRSLGVVPLGGRVTGLAVTADGRVLTAGTSGVKVLDPARRGVVATIGLQGSPEGIAVTPDGRHAVVTTRETNSLVHIDLATMTVTGQVEVGKAPTTVVVTPDGQQALVANSDGGSISVVDLAARTSTTLNVGFRPEAIALSPDGLDALVVTSSHVVRLERAES